MNNIYDEQFLNHVKSMIINNQFQSKKDLIDYIKYLGSLSSDEHLKSSLNNFENEVSNPVFSLIEFYDLKNPVENKTVPTNEEIPSSTDKENKYDAYTEMDLNIALTHSDEFPEHEVELMKEALESKQSNEITYVEKPKILTKKYDGYSSLLVLSLITGLGGISIFMYILLMIGG
ncbi:MAG: hypothetical protein RSH78_01980 [Bacilli bacterium]